MSYYEDFIETGVLCACCGELIDGEEGCTERLCAACEESMHEDVKHVMEDEDYEI